MSPPLCIVIDDKSYLVFYPQVDEFTLLEVQDCNFLKRTLRINPPNRKRMNF